MKEIKLNLTRQAQEAYSKDKPQLNRGGDIFMEGKSDMAPQNSQPTNPEHAEKAPAGQKNPVSSEQQALSRKAWDRLSENRVLSVNERRVLEEIIRRGEFPAVAGGTQEPVEETPPPPPVGPPSEEQPEQPPIPETRGVSGGGREQTEVTGGGDIFADIPEIPTNETDLQAMAREQMEEDLAPITDSTERQRIIDQRVGRLRTLRGLRDQIRRGTSIGMGNLEEDFNQINAAIRRGEIDPVSAQPYLTELARRAVELRESMREERTPEQVLAAERIIRETEPTPTDTPEQIQAKRQLRTEELKNSIDGLDPDGIISPELLDLMAQDEEASEKFVDKIISKPFAAPDADYRLSFYADINLQSFLTKVRNIHDQRKRYEKYIAQHETALRLHEMNRATASQSGNIEGFLNISRTVTPEHLQTGVIIDGVEQARQILDMAFARVYSGNKRITQDLYASQILEWSERAFEEKVRTGIIKSSFKGADGNPRNLEDWESKRAFALARNFQTSFYRAAELTSWSNVLEALENWLQSMPGETIVRVLANLKMLDRRMRVGATRGGPEYTTVLFDDINEDYNKTVYGKDYKKGKDYKNMPEDEKKGLDKVGQLDIRTDLLPVGFSPAGGFDKGWRTAIDYLGSDIMKINISDLASSLPAGATKDWLTKFIVERNRGNEQAANFGEFFVNTAVFANMAHGQDIKVEGIQVPKELLPSNLVAAREAMEDLLLPLLGGITPKSDMVDKIAKPEYKFNMEDFNYDPNQDQINFSLGILMNAGVSEKVRAILWTKAAEVLPLRLAYFLAEEGVRDVPGYGAVKGEGEYLFSDGFEQKLIALQLIRLREQKRIFLEQEEGIRRHRALPLSNYFAEAGLDTQEQEFTRRLQAFGKSKAADLAKVDFPHVPFLDDVPFQDANYIKLGAEVFPRRMGSDFRAYSESGNAVTQIVNNLSPEDNLNKPSYEKIEEHITVASEALSGPEGIKTGQDVAFKLYKTYFRLARQWSWTKIPGVKSISNFLGKPTSWLQVKFGPNADSWDARGLSLRARGAASKGNIRFEKLPGEKESQMNSLLKNVNARPLNVFLSELINALIAYLLYSSASFVSKTVSEKEK